MFLIKQYSPFGEGGWSDVGVAVSDKIAKRYVKKLQKNSPACSYNISKLPSITKEDV